MGLFDFVTPAMPGSGSGSSSSSSFGSLITTSFGSALASGAGKSLGEGMFARAPPPNAWQSASKAASDFGRSVGRAANDPYVQGTVGVAALAGVLSRR